MPIPIITYKYGLATTIKKIFLGILICKTILGMKSISSYEYRIATNDYFLIIRKSKKGYLK